MAPFYRLIINSVDSLVRSISATFTTGFPEWRDGFYFVDLPEFLPNEKRWQVAVESLVTSTPFTAGLMVRCDGFTQPNCYNTTGQGTNTEVFLVTNGAFTRIIHMNTVGIPVSDFTFIRGKVMRISFTYLDGSPIPAQNTLGSNFLWSLTLVVYPIPD